MFLSLSLNELVLKRLSFFRGLLFAGSLALLSLSATANIADWNMHKADFLLQQDKFSEAKDYYLAAQVKDPHNSRLNYNLGIADYRAASYEAAVNNFARSVQETKSLALKEKALYNLGNSFFRLEDYQKAINAYEQALEIDPNDEDTKHNLALAKKKLEDKKQKQPEKDKEDQEKEKDKKEKQDKKDKDKGDKDKDQDQSGKDKEDEQKKDKPEDKPEEKGPTGLSPQELESLLNQVKEAEANPLNQERLNAKKAGAKSDIAKPW